MTSIATANPPFKILVLVPSLEIGGAELDLVRTLPLLDRKCFEVSVLTFLRPGRLARTLEGNGIKVNALGDKRPPEAVETDEARTMVDWTRKAARLPLLRLMRKPAALAKLGYQVMRRLSGDQIDLIHTVLPNSYLLGSIGNRFGRRLPLVMSRVSLNWYQQDMATYRIAERHLHRTVDIAIGNSRAVLEDLQAEGIPKSKLRLVYNGIDAPAFARELIDKGQARARLGLDRSSLVISIVANLHPYKGHADLLRGLSLIADRLPADWTLLAAGRDIDGSKAMLHGLAAELGLARQVRFLGERTDVPAILSAADIHVSAAHTESLPNNILEAMCAQLPIVATKVGGVPEQLADGTSGFLVPARAPHPLAAAVERLVDDSELRARLGRAARERVGTAFRIENTVAALEDIYGSLSQPGLAR
jgi:glycosyltransferase involved in cell wall biosynthesis